MSYYTFSHQNMISMVAISARPVDIKVLAPNFSFLKRLITVEKTITPPVMIQKCIDAGTSFIAMSERSDATLLNATLPPIIPITRGVTRGVDFLFTINITEAITRLSIDCIAIKLVEFTIGREEF